MTASLPTPTRKQQEALARVELRYPEFGFSFADGGILVSDDNGQQAFAFRDATHPDGVSATATKGNRSQEAITRACQAVYHLTPHFTV